MIASMILLLGRAEINPAAVPRTLRSILTAEQIASLPPPPPPRARYIPGQPSTSGREFLLESRILELSEQNSNTIFSIQFEKRDGTLRNMNARIGVWKGPGGDESNPRAQDAVMSYDPSDYNLKTVFDMQKKAIPEHCNRPCHQDYYRWAYIPHRIRTINRDASFILCGCSESIEKCSYRESRKFRPDNFQCFRTPSSYRNTIWKYHGKSIVIESKKPTLRLSEHGKTILHCL